MVGNVLAYAAVAVVATASLAACGEPTGPSPTLNAAVDVRPSRPAASPSRPTPAVTADASDPQVAPSDGRPRRALLTIAAIGVHDLPVVPYRGKTDDAPGTRIQNRGVAASPFGARGGVGPGGIGNYQVTAHRTSSTEAFRNLPSLRRGQKVTVEAGGVRYSYEIRRTRQTSFRSVRSLAEQRAAVPGHPGSRPTKAFITLSTCATREDHARGNYWADEFGNPEHRIDKIGVLVRTADISDEQRTNQSG